MSGFTKSIVKNSNKVTIPIDVARYENISDEDLVRIEIDNKYETIVRVHSQAGKNTRRFRLPKIFCEFHGFQGGDEIDVKILGKKSQNPSL